MILTQKQEQGLQECIKRYKNREKYCVISGYAGAGKSTLVKVIIENLPGINPIEDVVYACYTGKAAQVLLKKGNRNVITLHKLLYLQNRLSHFHHLNISHLLELLSNLYYYLNLFSL